MLVYSLTPIKLMDLHNKCPAFIKCEPLIKNQAYYSMVLFKKSQTNKAEANLLRSMAECTGSIDNVREITSIIPYVGINSALEVSIGKCKTDKSIEELREEYYERLKFIDKYRG